ncbi:MAG: hypothetical protein ACE5OP_07170 [Candidatus Glassbacteria bacterium]
MTTGPNTGIDVFDPGRQDKFYWNVDPVFRSANISVAPLTQERLLIRWV